MPIPGFNTAYSGIAANALRLDVIAHNVANVNTDGFQPSEVRTSDLGYINDIGSGTAVRSTYQPEAVGPVVVDEQGQTKVLSGTDPSREMTSMLSVQAAYSVNIVMAQAVDALAGTVLDLKA